MQTITLLQLWTPMPLKGFWARMGAYTKFCQNLTLMQPGLQVCINEKLYKILLKFKYQKKWKLMFHINEPAPHFFLRYFILSIHVHVIAQQKLFYSHLGLDHIIFLCSSTYIFSHLHVYTISLLSVDHFKSNWIQKNVSKFRLKSKLREMLLPQDSRNIYTLFCFVMV